MIQLRDDKGRIAPDPNYDWKERFWQRVDKNGPVPEHCPELGPCWLWTGDSNKLGYGWFWIRTRKSLRAHRLGFFLGTGQWPDPELSICHHCDRPACVNSRHLFEGTTKQNIMDASAKGRLNIPSKGKKGEKNNHAKLTWQAVNDMREDKKLRRTHDNDLAAKYGISRRQVANIIENRQWVVPLPAASTIPAA